MKREKYIFALILLLAVAFFAFCGPPPASDSDDEEDDENGEETTDTAVVMEPGAAAERVSAPAALLPRETLVYLWTQLDFDSPTWDERVKLREKIESHTTAEALSSQLFSMFGLEMHSSSLEETLEDMKPWLRGEQAMAIISYDPEDYPPSQALLMFGVKDPELYAEYRAKLVERGEAEEGEAEEIAGRLVNKAYRMDIYPPEEYYLIENGYVFSCNREETLLTLFGQEGDTRLSDKPAFIRGANMALPDALAFIFFDVQGLIERIPPGAGAGMLSQMLPILQDVRFLTFSAAFGGEGMRVVLSVGLDESVRGEKGRVPEIIDAVPADVVGCFTIPDGARMIDEAIDLFRDMEGFEAGYQTFERGLRDEMGLTLDGDILPCLAGEVAILIFPKDEFSYSTNFAIVCLPQDEFRASDAFSRVAEAFAEQVESATRGGGPGVNLTVRVPGMDIHFRSGEGLLMVTSGADLAEKILDTRRQGGGGGLKTNESYRRALARLGVEGGGVIYMNWKELLDALPSGMITAEQRATRFIGNVVMLVNKLDGHIRLDGIFEFESATEPEEVPDFGMEEAPEEESAEVAYRQ